MLIKIEFESKMPIYKQLKNQIIEGIAKGELKPGESMPSVRKMAEDIGINLHTVNKAYKLLKNEGLLSTHRRKKVVVNSREQMLDPHFAKEAKEKLRPIIAKSYCKGINEEEFKNIVSRIYMEIDKEGK
ncbi:MAG: GntR family transcriptional regulator [Candidatus Marinimicrobia bacterium]|nr:GntR family transcriptional regulator [Candidatus Neomarinimicrobiota bacterium]